MRVRERTDERPTMFGQPGSPSGLGARFRQQAERCINAATDIAMGSLRGDSSEVNEAGVQTGGQ